MGRVERLARRPTADQGSTLPVAYNCPMKVWRPAVICFILTAIAAAALAQGTVIVLKPARVFDGATMHDHWVVRVKGDRIEAAGPAGTIDATGAKFVDLPGATL